MTKIAERRKEIEARKAELRAEMEKGVDDEKRLKEIREEARNLAKEEEELRAQETLEEDLKPGKAPVQRNTEMTFSEKFVKENRMSIPMFRENRSVLISSGKLATPTEVETEIGMLPETLSSLIDDVHVIDATGTGSWKVPYQKTKATAADVTEGSEVAGTGSTYDFVSISPDEWGILDEVSDQVEKMTPVSYTAAVRDAAYLALREEAETKLTAKVMASTIVKKIPSVLLDANYLRKIVLGYKAPKKLKGSAKLYINRADLITLGDVRGEKEKKAIFEIQNIDDNNGIIKEGAMAVPYSINDNLPVGQQLYGNPYTIDLMMWGDYEVTTDNGGDYFKRNMLGVKGDATANGDLVFYEGMQLINQSTFLEG